MSFYAYVNSLRDSKSLSSDSFEWQYKQRDKSSTLKIPPPITLHHQKYRNVDHVQVDQYDMQQFLDKWRQSGLQQFGVLVGSYERYDHVPLGISVQVKGIWTIPQENGADYVQLLDMDSAFSKIDEQVQEMGLQVVGCIMTDLTQLDDKVVCKRHEDSYYVSSAEVLFFAALQSRYKTTTPVGVISRFVNVVVSGNQEGGVEGQVYMVSNDCESMVQEKILEASVEPSVMRVCDDSRDVFFKEKGIVKTGKIVPVEYFIVNVSLVD
jgi:nuclear protein localization family protein 4